VARSAALPFAAAWLARRGRDFVNGGGLACCLRRAERPASCHAARPFFATPARFEICDRPREAAGDPDIIKRWRWRNLRAFTLPRCVGEVRPRRCFRADAEQGRYVRALHWPSAKCWARVFAESAATVMPKTRRSAPDPDMPCLAHLPRASACNAIFVRVNGQPVRTSFWWARCAGLI